MSRTSSETLLSWPSSPKHRPRAKSTIRLRVSSSASVRLRITGSPERYWTAKALTSEKERGCTVTMRASCGTEETE